MKTEKNIFVAFILNLLFSVIELIGGIFTGSIAIISDAVHDFGDATSIGTSFFFEKKSDKTKIDDNEDSDDSENNENESEEENDGTDN